MKGLALVVIALVLVISGLVGWNQYSKHKAQVEAEQQQRVEAVRQRTEVERQRVEEVEQQKLMQPQADWVRSNLDGHDWSHFIDNGDGTTFNEAEHVTADVSRRCSISVLERKENNFGFFRNECTINLKGFPHSGVSIEKVDQNNTVVDGIRMSTRPYWSVKFEDASRISCTDTFAGSSSSSDNVTIEFNTSEEASRMVSSFTRMTGDSCAN